MPNMQKIILNAIKAAAEQRNYIVVQDTNWANTGYLRFIKEGSFNAKAIISYNFQSDYAILQCTVNGEKLLPQSHRDNYFDYYLKYNNMDDLYNQMMSQLFNGL